VGRVAIRSSRRAGTSTRTAAPLRSDLAYPPPIRAYWSHRPAQSAVFSNSFVIHHPHEPTEKRSSRLRSRRLQVLKPKRPASRGKIHIDAFTDCLGEQRLGTPHRRVRRGGRAHYQDALPVRRMHIGAKPRPAHRRNHGHLKPAMTGQPLFDHRITGTKRNLRTVHVSTKHRSPPPTRYTDIPRTTGDRRTAFPAYPGRADIYRGRPARPGSRRSKSPDSAIRRRPRAYDHPSDSPKGRTTARRVGHIGVAMPSGSPPLPSAQDLERVTSPSGLGARRAGQASHRVTPAPGTAHIRTRTCDAVLGRGPSRELWSAAPRSHTARGPICEARGGRAARSEARPLAASLGRPRPLSRNKLAMLATPTSRSHPQIAVIGGFPDAPIQRARDHRPDVDGHDCRRTPRRLRAARTRGVGDSRDDYAGRILELEINRFARTSEEANQYGRRWTCKLSRGAERISVTIERTASS
jgi:hypothetical protein